MQSSESDSYPVSVNIYDLTQGMAKNMSQMFLGKQIDGVWHTGIVVYGKEYYFGGGICMGEPKQTPYGYPTKSEQIGVTHIPQEVFHQFLKDISPKFSMNTYDLFKNNCNNFTEECSQFLTGLSIPSYITGLPNEVLQTPFGKMIEPMISNFQNQMINSSQGNQVFPSVFEGGNNPQSLNFTGNDSNKNSHGGVVELNNFQDFFSVLENNSCVAIDFYSLTCPPCLRIKPIYAQIATDNKDYDIVFCACDISKARDVAEQLEIQSIPTFCFYYKLDLLHRFSGANEPELRKQIQNLKNLGGLKPNSKNGGEEKINSEPIKQDIVVSKWKLCDPVKYELFLYKSEKIDYPVGKIKSLSIEKLRNNENYESFIEFSINSENAFKYFVKEKKQEILSFLIENIKSYLENPSDEGIPFFDLIRICARESQYCEILAEKIEFIESLIEFLDKDSKNESVLLSRPVRVFMLRFICNLSSNEAGQAVLKQKGQIICNFLRIFMKNFSKSDKMCVETCIMILLNLVLLNSIIFKNEEEKELFIHEIFRNFVEEGTDNMHLGSLLIINYLSNKDKEINEICKKFELEKYFVKIKNSKNEKVVFALLDFGTIINKKI